MFAFLLSVNSNYKLTKFFSTKVVSLQRTTDTEPKKLQNLLGETIINFFFWAFFLILLVVSFFLLSYFY